jgi:hypothetical protein
MSTITTRHETEIYDRDGGTGLDSTLSHDGGVNAEAWDGQLPSLAQHGYLVRSSVKPPRRAYEAVR